GVCRGCRVGLGLVGWLARCVRSVRRVGRGRGRVVVLVGGLVWWFWCRGFCRRRLWGVGIRGVVGSGLGFRVASRRGGWCSVGRFGWVFRRGWVRVRCCG